MPSQTTFNIRDDNYRSFDYMPQRVTEHREVTHQSIGGASGVSDLGDSTSANLKDKMTKVKTIFNSLKRNID